MCRLLFFRLQLSPIFCKGAFHFRFQAGELLLLPFQLLHQLFCSLNLFLGLFRLFFPQCLLFRFNALFFLEFIFDGLNIFKVHFLRGQGNQPVVVGLEIVATAARSGGNAEPGVCFRLRRHDPGRVGNAHIIDAVSRMSGKGMLVIFDLIIRQIDQAQLENDRILFLEPDRLIKINVIFSAAVTVSEKHPLHACE